MKRAILIIVIVGMVGWAIYDFVISPSSAQKEEEGDVEVGLEVGNLAPNFELETLEGGSIKLSDLRGERVMVNFWATWCPPCRAEIPDLQKFYEDTDINILAVNLTDTENSFDHVPKFVENYGMEFPILMDEESSVSTTYQIQPIPTSFMIDSEGIIQYKAMGAMNYDLMVQEYEKMD
ncbi:MAG TPA: redoxin domain-containing protein [Candidatus Avamphibacillus sp.]|nr:redoxin domain-containing protein [Candidatus Avamphibacillus sp.]